MIGHLNILHCLSWLRTFLHPHITYHTVACERWALLKWRAQWVACLQAETTGILYTALFVLAAHVFTPTYHISYCSLWKMGTTEVKSTVSCMLTSRNYRYTIHRWFWSFIIIPTAEVIAVSSMSTLLKGALCSIALPGGPGEKYFDG